jgi:predicted RNA-binding protein with PUA-like domain
MATARKYWLMKTEPSVFSFDDLMQAPKRTTHWDGVRNYQARNFMRDEMKPGDGVFIYYSSTDEPGVAGVAEVAGEAYPDPSAFDKRDPHYDPASKPDAPTWYVVDVRGVEKLPAFVTLAQMRSIKALEGMRLLQKGNRLSITPVTRKEWEVVRALGGLGKD